MDGSSLTGHLLVASPKLSDGVFDRTVVLLLEHNDDGAMGLVLNEPSETSLAEATPEWVDLAAEPAVVFVGGPVDRSVAFGLGRGRDRAAEGWSPILGDVGVVDLSRDPIMVGVAVSEVRLFVGYAGWSAGQLEGEIEAGAWLVVDAAPDDPFHATPDTLYRDVLRRQAAPIALLSTYPPDPRQN